MYHDKQTLDVAAETTSPGLIDSHIEAEQTIPYGTEPWMLAAV